MIVMTFCALILGSLVFLGVRRIEVTLVGALGAMIFALPALRNALPGAPPLGVRADMLIFFWAELGAIIALCLFVAAWARRDAAMKSSYPCLCALSFQLPNTTTGRPACFSYVRFGSKADIA